MGVIQLSRARSGRLRDRHLAVKRLNPDLLADPVFVNMFLDETWMTAAIESPNVVRAEAWGQDAQGLYLAVELVKGVSLSRLVKESRDQGEPFAERTIAFLASQVCAGLEAAHALRGDQGRLLGLVHRDLTPGNILVGFDGVVKIADFGIARAEERLTQTRAGIMKGKPAYMAPEQARGGPVDARADVFSLGIILYELLTGKKPFVGASDLDVLVAVARTEPAPIEQTRKCHPMFVDLVQRCLKKNPRERIGSAAEVRAILDGWRAERGFTSDDLSSLALFVRRNTPEQMAWFQRALGGSFSKGGESFKEVEQAIDRRRQLAALGGTAVLPEIAVPAPRASERAVISSPAPVPSVPAPPTDRDPPRFAATAVIGPDARTQLVGPRVPKFLEETVPPEPDMAKTALYQPQRERAKSLAPTAMMDDGVPSRAATTTRSGRAEGKRFAWGAFFFALVGFLLLFAGLAFVAARFAGL